MNPLISKEANAFYEMALKNRIHTFDYESATAETFREMTKANTAAIDQCMEGDWEDVTIEKKQVKGFELELLNIASAVPGKYIYYIHGGGFVQGEAEWGHFCAVQIARRTRRNIVSITYRLAPEYRFPTAPLDCLEGYKYMLDEGIKPEDIIFLGESSGGNLVLAAAVACKQQKVAMPAAIVAISPVVNLNFDFPAYKERADRECILPYNQNRFAQHEYMLDKDLSNPLASPYFADCHGFPPVFLGVSTEEMLFDDSIKMHEKLLKEDVDSTLVVWEGMWHTFYMMDFPESYQVFDQVKEFCERFE